MHAVLKPAATAKARSLRPVAVMAAARTPMIKAFTNLRKVSAVRLGVEALQGALQRCELQPTDLDEVVFGNVSGPADAANVARVISLTAGVPQDRIAHTVHRNCGSGMEALIAGWHAIAEGRSRLVLAGGTESMSNIPMLFRSDAADLWMRLSKSRTWIQRLQSMASFRPRHFKPLVGIQLGLTDPVCGLSMGETAEILADEFDISRDDQDAFALWSHEKASRAQQACHLSSEIVPFAESDHAQADHAKEVTKDNGIRHEQSLEQLAKLRPIFRRNGSVTAGNSCQVTDGAAAIVLAGTDAAMEQVQDRNLGSPLGYLTGYAIAGCDPRRMGLGPVYATAKLLRQTGLTLDDFDLVEINEAFAAQVLACQKAAQSTAFAKSELGRETPLGRFHNDRLNVNGGAIALGHPVGTTGTRLIITLLHALRRKGLRRGLATLCVGGGQGMAMMVETQLETN